MQRSPHPPARNFTVHTGALPGLSQGYSLGGLSTTWLAHSRLLERHVALARETQVERRERAGRAGRAGRAERADVRSKDGKWGGASDSQNPAPTSRVSPRSRPFDDLLQQLRKAGNTIASLALCYLRLKSSPAKRAEEGAPVMQS